MFALSPGRVGERTVRVVRCSLGGNRRTSSMVIFPSEEEKYKAHKSIWIKVESQALK